MFENVPILRNLFKSQNNDNDDDDNDSIIVGLDRFGAEYTKAKAQSPTIAVFTVQSKTPPAGDLGAYCAELEKLTGEDWSHKQDSSAYIRYGAIRKNDMFKKVEQLAEENPDKFYATTRIDHPAAAAIQVICEAEMEDKLAAMEGVDYVSKQNGAPSAPRLMPCC